MKTAVPEEDFKLWDAGKSSKVSEPAVMPAPAPPKEDDILSLDKIDISEISLAVSGRRDVKKNAEGVRFVGFRVTLKMNTGKDLSGWMSEGDYLNLRRNLYRDGLVNTDNLEY